MSEYERGYRDGYRDGLVDLNKTWPKAFPDYPAPACSKCGLVAEGAMGYVCSISNCPLFPRATWDDREWQKAHERSKY